MRVGARAREPHYWKLESPTSQAWIAQVARKIRKDALNEARVGGYRLKASLVWYTRVNSKL